MQTAQQKHTEPSGLIPIGISEIERCDLLKYVSVALEEDLELICKYHFQDDTTEDMILSNLNNIEELAKTKEVKCFGVYLDDMPIGFTVVAERLLYSFGINVYCRQPDIVLTWYKWVRNYFKDDFVVCLYRENTRAINFFTRNGMMEFSDDGKVVYLINKN